MTIVFHAVAIILLLTLCFRTPLPLPGEAGVEVNLGMYAQGMGVSNKPNTAPKPTPSKPKAEPAPTPPSEDITSNDEETPAIEPEKKKDVKETEEKQADKQEVTKEDVQEPQEEKPEEKPVVNQNALFKVPTNNNNNSSSEGNTQQEGVQGSPNGLKDIDRYEGNGGSGGGPAYDLGGRGAKSISSPSKDFSEEGVVVVDIWVDKSGRVQRAEIGKGTTITNTAMRSSAIQAAKSSVFHEDENAADLQKGTITYKFIIRQ